MCRFKQTDIQIDKPNLSCAFWNGPTNWETSRNSDVWFEKGGQTDMPNLRFANWNRQTDRQPCRNSVVPYETDGQTIRHGETQMCRFKHWDRQTDRNVELQICLLKQTDKQTTRASCAVWNRRTVRQAYRNWDEPFETDGQTYRQTELPMCRLK